MSSLFELHERVRRLRQMLGYFRNAAVLTSAEVREAAQAGQGEQARQEWSKLIEEIGDCLAAAQRGAPEASAEASFKSEASFKAALGEVAGRHAPEDTLH